MTESGGEKKTFAQIKREVCESFGVTMAEFDSDSRISRVVMVRRLAWWRARQETSYSYCQLAKWSGNKNHTTVMYAQRKILSEMAERKGESRKNAKIFMKRYGNSYLENMEEGTTP